MLRVNESTELINYTNKVDTIPALSEAMSGAELLTQTLSKILSVNTSHRNTQTSLFMKSETTQMLP
jgi:hypothetical protein